MLGRKKRYTEPAGKMEWSEGSQKRVTLYPYAIKSVFGSVSFLSSTSLLGGGRRRFFPGPVPGGGGQDHGQGCCANQADGRANGILRRGLCPVPLQKHRYGRHGIGRGQAVATDKDGAEPVKDRKHGARNVPARELGSQRNYGQHRHIDAEVTASEYQQIGQKRPGRYAGQAQHQAAEDPQDPLQQRVAYCKWQTGGQLGPQQRGESAPAP